jgi:hypothetical protein
MYVNNTTFWKIILNPDFSRIVTILQDGNAASLYFMFSALLPCLTLQNESCL